MNVSELVIVTTAADDNWVPKSSYLDQVLPKLRAFTIAAAPHLRARDADFALGPWMATCKSRKLDPTRPSIDAVSLYSTWAEMHLSAALGQLDTDTFQEKLERLGISVRILEHPSDVV